MGMPKVTLVTADGQRIKHEMGTLVACECCVKPIEKVLEGEWVLVSDGDPPQPVLKKVSWGGVMNGDG